MLRKLLGGPDAGRNAVLAVLPVLVAAILLLGSGDRPSTESSLLETTRGPAWPTLLEDPGPTSTSVAPATSATHENVGATMAESLSPAGAGPAESASTPGSSWAPGRRANATSGSGSTPAPEPQRAAGSGTDAAESPAGVEDDASSGAGFAMDAAAPTEDSSTTTDVTPTHGPSSTSAAPTARAAETTTTTTAPAPTLATGGAVRDRAAEADVVPLTNQDRSAQGLGALSRNACLDSVASGYAEQMARSGVLAHNSGAGPAIQGCRPNSSWGDNVGTAAPCDTARLEREWMASPGHRRNILDGKFNHIGVGAWTDKQGGCWVQVLFSS